MTATTAYDFRALVAGQEVTHTVRVVTIEGAPWFVAKDVCLALGLAGFASDHTFRLDPDQRMSVSRVKHRTLAIFGARQPTASLVSESGLYNLALRAHQSPAAKPFQDWVTREVLPSIRKTGPYALGAGETMPLPTSFVDALRQHAATLIKLADERDAHAVTEQAG